MTIAILPMLIETFATGSVAVVAGMAVWYLFKHEKATTESVHQKNEQTQADTSATTPPKQDAPEPAISPVAETIASEVSQVIEIAKTAESSPVVMESSTETVDEEPMLRRHHLHNIRLMLEATTFPRPADSMLSRHYDEMIDAKADDCLESEAKMARLLADYEAYQTAQLVKERTVSVSESKRCIVPEDFMLKRHFLSNLRANIEKNKAPRPTDSALRRHFDAMINAEMENYLSCN